MVKKACKSNIIITGILLRDKSKWKRRNKLLKVNSYLSKFCKNKNNMLFMGQRTGWILHDNILDESLYYHNHINLVEPGNAKFTLNISNTINNFNELKYNLQSIVSRQLSGKPPLTFISKPLPTTSHPKPPPPIASPPKPLPPILPPKQLPTISPPKPLSTTSYHKLLPTTAPPKPPPLPSRHKPLSTISLPKPLPTSSLPKPTPAISPHKAVTTTSPHKPIPTTSPPKTLPPT